MAIHEISKRGPSISEADIEKVEQRIRAKLPPTYRQFMLAYNGGRPEPSVFGRTRIRSVLAYFCSIGSPAKHRDLVKQFAHTREWMPPEIIPIGVDECSNQVCLAVKGIHLGKVYLWDDDGAPERIDISTKYPGIIFNEDHGIPRPAIKDDWPGYPELTLIADNFTEFLDSFHDPDLDEPKVKRKRPR